MFSARLHRKSLHNVVVRVLAGLQAKDCSNSHLLLLKKSQAFKIYHISGALFIFLRGFSTLSVPIFMTDCHKKMAEVFYQLQVRTADDQKLLSNPTRSSMAMEEDEVENVSVPGMAPSTSPTSSRTTHDACLNDNTRNSLTSEENYSHYVFSSRRESNPKGISAVPRSFSCVENEATAEYQVYSQDSKPYQQQIPWPLPIPYRPPPRKYVYLESSPSLHVN